MDRYFENFPVIKYGNTQVVDITKRVAFLESVSKNPYVFYPYEITHNERADQLSSRYYEDSYKAWIIYLSNKILDPYYEWHLHSKEFEQFIEGKYGSLETAYNKVCFYRNNWSISDNLTEAGFDSLTPRLKIYWEPEYSPKGSIMFYKRREKDWVINTNKIVSYVVSNSSFTNNEICDVVFDEDNTGTAQVLSISNTSVYLQHTQGVTLSNTTVTITGASYIYGRESEVNTAFSNSSLISENIVDEEEVYWKPIYAWDYEEEKNNFNKTVRLIDNNFTYEIVTQFKKLMDE